MYFSTIFKIIKKGPDGVLGVNQGARSFTLPAAHRIRFFAYIWLVYVTIGTLYSIFRIHSARLRYRRYIVFDFSHTFGSFTLLAAHCIRFFAYIRLVYVTGADIVFDFSHTFGSFTLPAVHCIRFFAYIWLVYVTGGTLYSVFRIHSARLRYWRHIVFDFSHTFGSFTYRKLIVFDFSHTFGSFTYRKLIVFDFSHTFGSFTLPSVHRIRFFAYIWLVYVTGGTLYSVFHIHLSVSSTKTCISKDPLSQQLNIDHSLNLFHISPQSRNFINSIIAKNNQ
jgi:hypothetical protein